MRNIESSKDSLGQSSCNDVSPNREWKANLFRNKRHLVIAFALLSLAVLLSARPGPIAAVHANPAPTGGFWTWTPAGPESNSLQLQFYSGCASEFNDFQTANLDIADCPVPQGLLSGNSCRDSFGLYSNIADCPEFQVASGVSTYTVHSFEFNFVNNFWSCFFQNGASSCGRQIRQGIAHLVDKQQFVSDVLNGRGSPVDCFAPPVQKVPCNGSGWNPCSWDSLYPAKYSSCISGYNFASESFSTLGVQSGTPDFCAAADHFLAAGVGTSKDSNCVLQGLSGAASTDTLNLWYDNNNPYLTEMANLLAQSVNALMNRNNAVTLCPGAADGVVLGADTHDFTNLEPATVDSPISSVPQYPDSPPGSIDNLNPCKTWHMATVTWSLDPSFDQFYLVYNSNFTHKFGYYWNTTVDTWTTQVKYGSSRDQALAAAQQAELYLGADVASIPVYAGLDTLAYRTSMGNVINQEVGNGPLGWWTTFNAVSSSPSGSETIRRGMSATTNTLNIFNIGTASEAFVLGEVYDSLLVQDPANPLVQIGSLAYSYSVDYPSRSISFTLRGDVYWHDGVQFTANDVKFSILAARDASPSPFKGLVEQVQSVTVSSPTFLTVYYNQLSPFDLWETGELPIIPQHIWAAVNSDGSLSFSADPQKTTISYDPVTNFGLVGTGPFVCKSVFSDHSQGKPGGYCTMTGSGQSGGGSVGIGGVIFLQRYGLGGTHSISDQYFRSIFNLAQWAWADANGDRNVDLQDLASASSCVGASVSSHPECAQFDAIVPVKNLLTGANDGANSCVSGGTYCVGGNGDGVVEQAELDKVQRWFLNAANWVGGNLPWDPQIVPNIAVPPITTLEGPSEQYVAQFTPPAPDFTVSSTSVSTPRGTTGTATVTVTAINGFTGTVTLTAAAQPGLQCGSMTPGSVTGSGTSNLSCSSTVPGTYNVTVTGTSGALSRSTSFKFTITDFSISNVSPNAVDVGVSSPAANCSICGIYVSGVNSFAGTVALSYVPVPNLSCGLITPSSVTVSGSSYAIANLSCTSTIAGNYNVTITGTVGSLSHSTVETFTFQDFSISSTFSPVVIPVGSENSATFNLVSLPTNPTTIYSQMFSDTVNLSIATSSSSVSCWSFGGSSTVGLILQGGKSFLVPVTCTGSQAGAYIATVTASSSNGPLVHTATVGIQITDFSITGRSSVFIDTNQASTTISISSINGFPGYGFAGNINLTTSAPPALSISCPTSVTIASGGTASAQCTLSSSVPGLYTVTVTGTYLCNFCYYGAKVTHSTTFQVAVLRPVVMASSVNSFNSGTTTYLVNATGSYTVNIATMNLTGTISVTTKNGAGILLHSGTAQVSIPFDINGVARFNIETPASGAWILLKSCAINIPSGTQSCTSLSFSADVNHDGKVDILDLSTIGGAFGSTPSSAGWNPRADINGDGKVDILDLSIVGGQFGSVYLPLIIDPGLAAYGVPNSLSAAIGAGTSSVVTYTSTNGFSGTVSITTSVSPSGPTCSVATSNISLTPGGNASITLSCSVPLGTLTGQYTVYVTGTAGSETDTLLVTLQATDFNISTSAQTLTTLSGTSVRENVTLTSVNGFNDPVSLSVAVTPSSGLSCSISPLKTVPTSVVVMNCTGSSGLYNVAVTGTDGNLAHSASTTVTVQDFTLGLSRTSVTVRAGQNATSTVYVTPLNGFTGTVTLTLAVSPSAGLTCTLSSTSVFLGSSGTSVLSCGGVSGWYTVTVNGTSRGVTHSVSVDYTVSDFSVSVAPASVTMMAGTLGNSTVVLSSLASFTGTVSLTYTVVPANGLTCTLTPSSVTLTAPQIQPQVTVSSSPKVSGSLAYGFSSTGHGGTVSPNTGSSGTSNLSCRGSAGVYAVSVKGTSSTLAHTATVVFSIQDFSVSASSTNISIAHGTSGGITITLTSLNGFAGNVTLSATVSPVVNHGPTANLSPSKVSVSSSSSGASTLTISTLSTTPKQQYTITVTASSGSLTHTIVLILTVT